jgi:hypothetical protein
MLHLVGYILEHDSDLLRSVLYLSPITKAVITCVYKAWTDPEGSRSLRLSGLKTIGTLRWQDFQP